MEKTPTPGRVHLIKSVFDALTIEHGWPESHHRRVVAFDIDEITATNGFLCCTIYGRWNISIGVLGSGAARFALPLPPSGEFEDGDLRQISGEEYTNYIDMVFL